MVNARTKASGTHQVWQGPCNVNGKLKGNKCEGHDPHPWAMFMSRPAAHDTAVANAHAKTGGTHLWPMLMPRTLAHTRGHGRGHPSPGTSFFIRPPTPGPVVGLGVGGRRKGVTPMLKRNLRTLNNCCLAHSNSKLHMPFGKTALKDQMLMRFFQ